MAMNDNSTVVSRCDATHCRFNEGQRCQAGQIEVSSSAQHAECLTFAPREEAQASSPSAQQ